MKRPLLLILIIISLFLPVPWNEDGCPANDKKEDAQTLPSPSDEPVATKNPLTAKEENSPKNESAYWPPIWSNWALFLATIGLGIAAFCTLRTIQRQTDAIQQTAKATDEALRVYRPFLVVLEPTFEWTDPANHSQSVPRLATIRVQNDGLGPADIVGFSVEFGIFEWDETTRTDPKITYNGPTHKLIQSVIAAGKTREIVTVWGDISLMDFKAMTKNTKRLAVHGIIYYRGGPDKPYWTRFFWWHLVDGGGPQTVRASTEELNAHT